MNFSKRRTGWALWPSPQNNLTNKTKSNQNWEEDHENPD